MKHTLKTHRVAFAASVEGKKFYEVRRVNGSGAYEVGDAVRLQEWNREKNVLTGRTLDVQITYVTQPGKFGLPKDVCVFGFERIRTNFPH